MKHHYIIRVNDQATTIPEISFDFESHDDLVAILRKIETGAIVSEQESKAFCVGLKLLGSAVMKHRDDPTFSDFAAAFGCFMRMLKASGGGSDSAK